MRGVAPQSVMRRPSRRREALHITLGADLYASVPSSARLIHPLSTVCVCDFHLRGLAQFFVVVVRTSLGVIVMRQRLLLFLSEVRRRCCSICVSKMRTRRRVCRRRRRRKRRRRDVSENACGRVHPLGPYIHIHVQRWNGCGIFYVASFVKSSTGTLQFAKRA